ncbi:MAG: hypothetical protein H0X25_21845 [Acidobacteriales bacterium]|nr:hypothetical protein [Terriglobales bacterium]
MIFDGNGNIFGTTKSGGRFGQGTAFELSPVGDGSWKEQVLHSFGASGDGIVPYVGLVLNSAGNLFGVTNRGGTYDTGVAFELSPTVGAGWTETIIHNFGKGEDGQYPVGGLAIDQSGSLYGTAEAGGAHGIGLAFELSPVDGGWKETILHQFASPDGGVPTDTLTFDSSGHLFGTTTSYGRYSKGTVFELSPTGAGTWKLTVLYDFGSHSEDGYSPFSGVTLSSTGTIYGTTTVGGKYGLGTIFQLSPNAGEAWNQTVLYDFSGYWFGRSDGAYPYGKLTLDPSDNLYGTTVSGGSSDGGLVFDIATR